MKRLILSAALALAFTGTSAFAQAPDTPQAPDAPQTAAPAGHHHAGNAHKEAGKLAKQLDLTPDQQTKIEPIFVDRNQKIAAVMNDTTLTEDARKQQIRTIRKEANKQVNALLTPDQRTQVKTMRQAHHSQDATPVAAPPPSA